MEGNVSSAVRRHLAFPLAILLAAPATMGAGPSPVTIAVEAPRVACVAVDGTPRIAAALQSSDPVAAVRLYFRSLSSSVYRSVEMSQADGLFVATMPRDLARTGTLVGYVMARGVDGSESRSIEVSLEPGGTSAACSPGAGTVPTGPTMASGHGAARGAARLPLTALLLAAGAVTAGVAVFNLTGGASGQGAFPPGVPCTLDPRPGCQPSPSR